MGRISDEDVGRIAALVPFFRCEDPYDDESAGLAPMSHHSLGPYTKGFWPPRVVVDVSGIIEEGGRWRPVVEAM